ncbi:MAG: AraC-like DNA-binding protein [Alphaproteobacteria bacterium]|jgi:AraC-like DNA-binding protein
MNRDNQVIDNLLTIYQHRVVIIAHPAFGEAFHEDKPAVRNRIPFHCVEKGSCTVTCNDNEYTLKMGDFVAIMRGGEHVLTVSDDQALEETTLICGYFEFLDDHNQLLMESFPEILVSKASDIEKSKKIKTLSGLMMQEINSGNPGSEKATAMLADLFFIEILRAALNDRQANKGLIAAFADKNLALALDAFHNNFDLPWTLDSLAKEAGVSRTKFAINFKEVVGISPGNYITQWRIHWAAAQLRDTKSNLYQIALAAGYHSNASFTRAFRKQMEASPDIYRKKYCTNNQTE